MTDQKTINSLKNLIRKQIAEVKGDKPKNMYQTAAEITKTAAAGIAAVQALKSKVQMPSAKAMEAIGAHVDALEKILHDCLATPLAYLDVTPEEVVDKRRSDLDARASALEPGPGPQGAPKKAEPALMDNHSVQETNVAPAKPTLKSLSAPTACPTCGSNYDKALHPDCPTCEEATDNASVQQWIEKLRKLKTT
jgi:hypothetical protein